MSNNLRDQFPGIAKTDDALSTAWSIAQGLILFYLLGWGLSGWYRITNLKKSYLWTTKGDLFGVRAAIILTLIFILSLILSVTLFDDSQWFTDKVLVRSLVALVGGWCIGVVLIPIAWIINWVVGDDNK